MFSVPAIFEGWTKGYSIFNVFPTTSSGEEWFGEKKHELLTCSIARNVPTLEAAKCFLSDGSSADLVRKLIKKYLHQISGEVYTLLHKMYNRVFWELDLKITANTNKGADTSGDAEERAEEEEVKPHLRKHQAEKLKEEFDRYLKELPMLGFNSGRYDHFLLSITSMPSCNYM